MGFPHFDGHTPVLEWIFKAEKFFNYHHTPDSDRVEIAAIHFEKDVIPWFQMPQCMESVNSWSDLTLALESQFRPSPFDCPMSELFKLQQTGIVSDYYLKFMALANRSEGFSNEVVLNCFLSGLNADIHRDVIAQTPMTLIQVVSLAKLYEEKYQLETIIGPSIILIDIPLFLLTLLISIQLLLMLLKILPKHLCPHCCLRLILLLLEIILLRKFLLLRCN